MPNNNINVKQNNTKKKPKNKKSVVTTKTTVTSVPIAKNAKVTIGTAKITNKPKGTRIVHCEYIADVVSRQQTFDVTRYAINPGLEGTFPWLSTIANRYEYYKFNNLKFEYKPVCPTTTPGTVYMCTDYDAADPTPSTKIMMMSYDGANRTAPWDTASFTLKNSSMHKFAKERFTRPTTATTNDVKTYDVGNFYIATANTQTGSPVLLGELYVHYDVELSVPQIGRSSISLTPSQRGTFSLNEDRTVRHRGNVFNTVNEALMWADSFESLPNNVIRANMILQGLNAPAILQFFSAKPQWSTSGSKFKQIMNLHKNVFDSFSTASPVANSIAVTNEAQYGATGSNTDNTNATLAAQFLIGARSYGSSNANPYIPFSIDFSTVGAGAGSFALTGNDLFYSIIPIQQNILDEIITPITSEYINVLTTDYSWKTIKIPTIEAIASVTEQNSSD